MDAGNGKGGRAQRTTGGRTGARTFPRSSGDPETAQSGASGHGRPKDGAPSLKPVADPQENPSDARFEGATEAHCQHMVEYATRREPFVKFMIEKLAESGCKVGNDFSKSGTATPRWVAASGHQRASSCATTTSHRRRR